MHHPKPLDMDQEEIATLRMHERIMDVAQELDLHPMHILQCIRTIQRVYTHAAQDACLEVMLDRHINDSFDAVTAVMDSYMAVNNAERKGHC